MHTNNEDAPKWKLSPSVKELWSEIIDEDHGVDPLLSLGTIAALRRLHLAFPDREYFTLGEIKDIVWQGGDRAELATLNHLSYLSHAQLVRTNGRIGHHMQIKLLAFRPLTDSNVPQYEIVGNAPILRILD